MSTTHHPALDATKVDVKIFAKDGSHPDTERLVSALHGFIQDKKIADELLLDVTSYDHCKSGPGVMLIGHEGQYGLDDTKNKLGLLYSQRRAQVTGLEAALRRALKHAIGACALLENDPSLEKKLAFGTQEVMIRINDRLAAPNTSETFGAIEATVSKVLAELFAGDVRLEPAPPGRELLTIHARSATATSLATLASRLG